MNPRPGTTQPPGVAIFLIAAALFLASGATALVYEILWMKQLSLLFGNSAQAAAATLAAFFSGIAAGNAYWGRRASTVARPLRSYALLEFGVAASAVFYFGVFVVYDGVYQTLFNALGDNPAVFTLIKFVLAFALFFPAAFFMGGTLPMMTQYLIERNHTLMGQRAAAIYAVNTFGAASGALAAGFFLPQTFGFQVSYLGAMAATILVGLIAYAVDRTHHTTSAPTPGGSALEPPKPATTSAPPPGNPYSPREWHALAALSGFTALALQVLWIRMFAQVLQNSVYTYAAILTVFLLALAIGGTIARACARQQFDAKWFVPLLLTATGLLVAISPLLFHAMGGARGYVGGDADFAGYLVEIAWLSSTVIGIPVCMIGVLLPYLFKLAESGHHGPGEAVGRLVTTNTVAAIAGSIAAGFLLLDWLGLWSSLRLMAALYLTAAIWLLLRHSPENRWLHATPLAGMLLLTTLLDTSRLPTVRIDPIKRQETLLKVWEGADATVAVVRQGVFLRTKLNNWYTLGGTGDMATQETQTHLPMLLHKNPQRVFYLGLGTGITAGTALKYDIERLVVTEVAPSVIDASREFFGDYTNGLFDDPRARVIAEDGRNVLRGLREHFDLIISDLFVPWKAGTGTLYTIEHYTTALQRLEPGGMYVQWLPLYQMTQQEFAIVARTMLEVFPRVTMWRGNFWGDKAVLALMGHRDADRFDAQSPLLQTSRLALRQHLDPDGDTIPLIAHYAGHLLAEEPLFADVALNTDNLPMIEYLAPINHRLEKAGQAEWFADASLLAFVAAYVDRAALAADPYLQDIDATWYDAIQAGYYLQVSNHLKRQADADADQARQVFRAALRKAARGVWGDTTTTGG